MTANINPKTGIRYGVIACNSLDADVQDELWYGSGAVNVTEEAVYEEAKKEFAREWANALEEAGIAANEVDPLMSEGTFKSFVDARMNNSKFGSDEEDYIDREMEYFDPQIDEPLIEGTCDGVDYAILYLGGAPIVYIAESPHLVHVKSLCSLCVPNAGDLDSGFAYGSEGDTYGPPLGWLSDEARKEMSEKCGFTED